MSERLPATESPPDARRIARRQMIRSALGAAPIVLTITAGTARAGYGSGYHSGPPDSKDEQDGLLEGLQAAGLSDQYGIPAAWDEGDPLFGS